MADEKRKLPDRDHKSDMIIEWAPRINMFIKKIRSKPIPPHIEDTDLHWAGVEGLMDAFARHDPQKGSFHGLANARIEGKMRDFIKESGGANRVDPKFRADAKKFRDKLARQAPKSPTEED